MANFLYNGIELPKPPDYDTAAYPYAGMWYIDGNLFGFPNEHLIAFNAFDSALKYDNDEFVVDSNYTYYMSVGWIYTVGNNIAAAIGVPPYEWFSEGEAGGNTMSVEGELFWANYEVLNLTDGSVYLAASTPIRAGSKLKISVGGGSANGDGFALYNGYKLPDITPYLHTGSYTNDAALIYKLDVSAYADGDLFYLESSNLSGVNYRLYCATTQEVVSVAAQMGLPLAGVYVWTNPEDIELPSFIDGSVIWATRALLEASAGSLGLANYVDPIPLDGYTVIEWDGNTEGLESLDNMWFKVSDNVADKEAAKNGIVVMSDNIISDTGYHMELSDDVLGLETGSVILVYADGADLEGITAEHKGTYFLNAAMYTQLFAYKAISSDGGVTDTTATVEFTCTNLENTEPIDSIKAWVYKKSDGLNTTIPATWTSELFSAPSYSTTHTFTGLEPNTEYEVYGCIFVNGEATDHNAIAEFTTLEGSGDIKPVYKRESGTWVKKTAYERQNSEWVLISTADSKPSANGDGFALYNGVKLPKLPEWDRTKYPCAMLTHYDGSAFGVSSGFAIMFDVYDLPLMHEGNLDFVVDTNHTRYTSYGFVYVAGAELGGIIGVAPDTWIRAGETGGNILGAMKQPTWSNYDILNLSDGSTYLAASDPIPLDGYAVIEWDGNTEGLPVDSDIGWYYTIEAYVDATSALAVVNNSGSLSVGEQFAVLPGGWFVNADIFGTSYPVVMAYSSEGILNFAHVDTGEGIIYTTLLAYKA